MKCVKSQQMSLLLVSGIAISFQFELIDWSAMIGKVDKEFRFVCAPPLCWVLFSSANNCVCIKGASSTSDMGRRVG